MNRIVQAVILILTVSETCAAQLPESLAQILRNSSDKKSAAVETKSHKDEEKSVGSEGSGIQVDALIARGSAKAGQVTYPTWEVTLVVRNFTEGEIELGESLVVLEQAPTNRNYVACYVSRRRDAESPHLKKFKLRYGLDWGQEIELNGSSMLMFVGGGGVNFSFSHDEVYEGFGYGKVSSRAERRLTVKVPMPYLLKNAKPEYVFVLAPAVRSASGGALMARPVFRFAGGDPQRGVELKPLEIVNLPADLDDNIAAVADKARAPWWRLAAMNGMVEDRSGQTTEVLLARLADAQDLPVVRASAAVNLGVSQDKEGVAPLLEVANKAAETGLRTVAVEALGDIGDLSAAPFLRSLFAGNAPPLAAAAIRASARLKDPEAIAPLSTLLSSTKVGELQDAALDALAAIGTSEAIKAMIGIAGDKTKNADLRSSAVKKLGATGSPEAVATIVALVSDKAVKAPLRRQALGALGQLGGQEAVTTLKMVAAQQSVAVRFNDDERDAAIDALAKVKDPAGIAALVEIVDSAGHPGREQAIRAAGLENRTEALPAIRRLVADKQAPKNLRLAGCFAIERMKDAGAVEALRSALDESQPDLYWNALGALRETGSPEGVAVAITALSNARGDIRHQAAMLLAARKSTDAAVPLWNAYRAETEAFVAEDMASALIESKFSSREAIPFLIGRLNPKTNRLWFQDVRLLRHVSGQELGPESQYEDDKVRDAELAKWREWWAANRRG